MRGAANADVLWDAFSMGVESLGLDHATFHVFGQSDSEMRVLTWRHDDLRPADVTAEDRDGWTARFRVRNNGHVLGKLEIGKVVEGHSLLADAPELVGRLLSEMGARLEKLRCQNDE